MKTCPKDMAAQDKTYNPMPGTECSWHVNGQYKCNGEHHYLRHHRQQWIVENPGNLVPDSQLGQTKGKGKGRFKGTAFTKRIAVLEDGAAVGDHELNY